MLHVSLTDIVIGITNGHSSGASVDAPASMLSNAENDSRFFAYLQKLRTEIVSCTAQSVQNITSAQCRRSIGYARVITFNAISWVHAPACVCALERKRQEWTKALKRLHIVALQLLIIAVSFAVGNVHCGIVDDFGDLLLFSALSRCSEKLRGNERVT